MAQAYSLVDDADALLVAGLVADGVLRTTASSGTPLPAACPIAIINRGRTRGDDLATVKVDGGCSPILVLLAEELPIAMSA